MRIPGRQGQGGPQAHSLEDGIGDEHHRQIHADMVDHQAQDAPSLGVGGVALPLQTNSIGVENFQ